MNCRKSDILKSKQVVSLVKRFSSKFFQCLRSSPPASPHAVCNCLLFIIWRIDIRNKEQLKLLSKFLLRLLILDSFPAISAELKSIFAFKRPTQKPTARKRAHINYNCLDSSIKEKEKGPAPRCRACTQNEDELTVNVTGLYVHYEQNLVTETMFYFCPKQQRINNIPYWTNLKPPDGIRADRSISDITIVAFKDNGLPL